MRGLRALAAPRVAFPRNPKAPYGAVLTVLGPPLWGLAVMCFVTPRVARRSLRSRQLHPCPWYRNVPSGLEQETDMKRRRKRARGGYRLSLGSRSHHALGEIAQRVSESRAMRGEVGTMFMHLFQVVAKTLHDRFDQCKS